MSSEIDKEITTILSNKKSLDRPFRNGLMLTIQSQVLPVLLFQTNIELDFATQGWEDNLIDEMSKHKLA
jgi:hypothetical protein